MFERRRFRFTNTRWRRGIRCSRYRSALTEGSCSLGVLFARAMAAFRRLDGASATLYCPRMNLCIYEDLEAGSFGPLTLLRPVFALRCGIFTLAEKLALAFPEAKLHLLVRPHLEEWARKLDPRAEATEPSQLHARLV